MSIRAWTICTAFCTIFGGPFTVTTRSGASVATPYRSMPPCVELIARICSSVIGPPRPKSPRIFTTHPVSFCMDLMENPPAPMTVPTQCAGHITFFVIESLSCRTMSSISSTHAFTASIDPEMITRRGASSSVRKSSGGGSVSLAPVWRRISVRPRPLSP
eukprot:29916-Pelagococcus_subviridis.AAC.3